MHFVEESNLFLWRFRLLTSPAFTHGDGDGFVAVGGRSSRPWRRSIVVDEDHEFWIEVPMREPPMNGWESSFWMKQSIRALSRMDSNHISFSKTTPPAQA
jgi:hypothetical protein